MKPIVILSLCLSLAAAAGDQPRGNGCHVKHLPTGNGQPIYKIYQRGNCLLNTASGAFFQCTIDKTWTVATVSQGDTKALIENIGWFDADEAKCGAAVATYDAKDGIFMPYDADDGHGRAEFAAGVYNTKTAFMHFVNNKTSSKQALEEVEKACAQNRPQDQAYCTYGAVYSGCLAMAGEAMPSPNTKVGTGKTRKEAEADAMALCGPNCGIKFWICSPVQ